MTFCHGFVSCDPLNFETPSVEGYSPIDGVSRNSELYFTPKSHFFCSSAQLARHGSVQSTNTHYFFPRGVFVFKLHISCNSDLCNCRFFHELQITSTLAFSSKLRIDHWSFHIIHFRSKSWQIDGVLLFTATVRAVHQ